MNEPGPPLNIMVLKDPLWNDPQIVQTVLDGFASTAGDLNRRLVLCSKQESKPHVVVVFYDSFPPARELRLMDEAKEQGAYVYIVSRY